MTIAEFEKIVAKQQAQKTDTDNRIAENKKKTLELTEQTTKAAMSGDLEQYKALMAQINDLKSDLFVLEKYRENLESNIPDKEAAEAWADYVAAYNKKFASKYKQFEKAKRDLLTLYGELLEGQNEAFKTRDRIGECCGIKTDKGIVSKLEVECPLSLLPDDQKRMEKALFQGNIDMIFYAVNTYVDDRQYDVFDIVQNRGKSTRI